MRNQPLFDLMARDHGLTLLESEMHEIELTVARTLADDRVRETARSRADSVPCSEWVGACPWCGEKTDTRTVSSGEMHEQEQCMRCGARSPTRRIGRREAPTDDSTTDSSIDVDTALVILHGEIAELQEENARLRAEIELLKEIAAEAVKAMNDTTEAALRQAAMFPESEAET